MRRGRLALLLLLAAAIRVSPETEATQGLRVLYPADHSVLTGPVRLIVATAKDADPPSATFDGRPLTLTKLLFDRRWRLSGKLQETAKRVGERRATALWVVTLDLPTGAHTVTIAGHHLDLWRSGDAAPPAESRAFHSHAPVGVAGKLDCDGCHEQPDGSLGVARTPQACEDCHDEAAVQLVHQHVFPPLARCALCHDPHGTMRPKMLVAEKQVLCSRCHEAGHSKE